MIYDAIIVGAGPSGLTCALYLERAKKSVLIVERFTPGGQLLKIENLSNYPGISHTTGIDLAMNMVDSIKIPIQIGAVSKIIKEDSTFHVTIDDYVVISRTVIIATGISNVGIDIPNARSLVGKGLSFCASCDGTLYQDKEVIIYGTLNKSLDEAIYLSGIAKKVTVINPTSSFQESPKLDSTLAKINGIPNIEVIYQAQAVEILSEDDSIKGLSIEKDGVVSNISATGVFVYLGNRPQTQFLDGFDVCNSSGYISVDRDYQTKVTGLYACGDCVDYPVKQIATAVGQAASAATQLIKVLNLSK